MFSIIKKTKLRITISIVVMAAALWLFFTNMSFSIQFTGGMEVVIEESTISSSVGDEITETLTEAGYQDFTVSLGKKDNRASVLIQLQLADDAQVSEVTTLVQDTLLATDTIASKDDILEQSIIGPSIGDYIKKSARSAIIVGVIMMAIYILFAFSSMRDLVSPFLLGLVTIFTMLFDVAIASGAYGALMALNPAVQIDTIFIIAVLTVMGYSVNDTIVILDRVRENYLAHKSSIDEGGIKIADVFEKSLWQTMRRSLATSGSTLLIIASMYIFGTGILRMFAFTLGLGVIAGTYSSIFLAAPLAYLLSKPKKTTS